MATGFGALCNDFYVNHKLALRMDLPNERETVLHLYDRIRKSRPAMNHFRRFENELALESSRDDPEYYWLAMRRTSVRTGHVNPQTMEAAYDFHRLVLEVTPYHLTISPLDVDYQELMFGFDLECPSGHDEVVYEALISDSPLADLLKIPGSKLMDVQPLFGMHLDEDGYMQAYFEVKSCSKSKRGQPRRYRDEPISVFVTVRKYGPIDHIKDLVNSFDELAVCAEALATDYLIPNMLMPIARQITSSSR